MKPELFSIGPFTVHGYGLMIAVGILAAVWLAERRAPRFGLDSDRIFDLAVWAIAGGLIGSKVLYWIVDLPEIIEDPSILLDIGHGFVIYGAIIGGIVGVWLYCRLKKVDFLQYFDLAIPSVALAQGFGRIGCFLAGCCYGRETESWFHVIFTESHIAPNGVPLIPTQLISSAADFLNFAVLMWIAKKTEGDGQVAGFYLIFYSVGRGLIETLRDDYRGSIGPLSTSQFISIFIFIAGVAMVIACGKRGRRPTEGQKAAA